MKIFSTSNFDLQFARKLLGKLILDKEFSKITVIMTMDLNINKLSFPNVEGFEREEATQYCTVDCTNF